MNSTGSYPVLKKKTGTCFGGYGILTAGTILPAIVFSRKRIQKTRLSAPPGKKKYAFSSPPDPCLPELFL